MQYLTLLITVPLALFSVLFVLANGDAVTFYLWPEDDLLSMTLPGWQFGLGMLFGGFFLGALFVSLLAQKTRFRYWQESRKATRLEKELEALHAAAEAEKDQQAQARHTEQAAHPPSLGASDPQALLPTG